MAYGLFFPYFINIQCLIIAYLLIPVGVKGPKNAIVAQRFASLFFIILGTYLTFYPSDTSLPSFDWTK